MDAKDGVELATDDPRFISRTAGTTGSRASVAI
jgi:hypothetical protein